MTEHTGIRLRIDLPGAGTIMQADSDWLHMTALLRGCEDQGIGIGDVLLAKPGEQLQPGQGWIATGDGSVGPWHQVMGGGIEVWVQPVMLTSTHADDVDDQADDVEQPTYCECSCSNCSGCLGL